MVDITATQSPCTAQLAGTAREQHRCSRRGGEGSPSVEEAVKALCQAENVPNAGDAQLFLDELERISAAGLGSKQVHPEYLRSVSE